MKKLNFIYLINCDNKLYNNITLSNNCLGEIMVFVSIIEIFLSLKTDILKKLLSILIYLLNKMSIFYKIIFLLIDKIIIIYSIIKFIYNFINYTLVLKFYVSNNNEYPKRERSPEDKDNTELST